MLSITCINSPIRRRSSGWFSRSVPSQLSQGRGLGEITLQKAGLLFGTGSLSLINPSRWARSTSEQQRAWTYWTANKLGIGHWKEAEGRGCCSCWGENSSPLLPAKNSPASSPLPSTRLCNQVANVELVNSKCIQPGGTIWMLKTSPQIPDKSEAIALASSIAFRFWDFDSPKDTFEV